MPQPLPGITGEHPRRDPVFAPKLVSVLREGYGLDRLRRDAVAGLTVAIVALPLSMALAIASGGSPSSGLYSAIVGGFLVSALGGSRFQIGGPAGAFIVLISAIISRHGFDGLMLAMLMAGVLLVGIGFLRLGSYIRYIPHPVLVGFTTGIAIIIFASQIRDLLGLALPGREPAALWPKLQMLAAALPSLNLAAVALSAATIACIVGLKRWRPAWPGLLIAVTGATLLTAGLGPVMGIATGVETIGTRFGGIAQAFPLPSIPAFDLARLVALLPDAASLALLAGIESLLSAVVADGMSGRRHRPDTELIAQGFANMGSALFGGICVTGTIARTATNIRAGATSPVSGMLAALYLLAFILVAAPLAAHIPLAALAGVLAVVSWNMAEKKGFAAILRHRGPDMAVLLVTFGLTLFADLMLAIAVGVIMGSLIFMHRMSGTVAVGNPGQGEGGDGPVSRDPAAMVYTLHGPLFFGAASAFGTMLERISPLPAQLQLDMTDVPIADTTAADVLADFIRTASAGGCTVTITGARGPVRKVLDDEGLGPYLVD